jgi:hypothetical protein
VAKIFIAVGGAGQMVLHHYAQLYLLGQCQEVFSAYILDTDSGAKSLLALKEFFDSARRALSASDARGIPSIRFIQINPETDEGDVDQLLMQQDLPAQAGYHHPCQAFFDRDCLRMSIRQGMFARPSLSAVVSFADAIHRLRAEQFENDARIVVTGSCIGGTGGGLLIPLIWHLSHVETKDFKITPVLLGDFFRPSQTGTLVGTASNGGDAELFRSNRLAFLACLEEAVPNLSQFAFVEEQRMESRDWNREQAAWHLPWAAADEPYWKAAAACEHLLREVVAAPAQKFTQREAAEEAYARKFSLEIAVARLGIRLGRVEGFLDRHLLALIRSEAPVRRVWGDAIVNYLVSAWLLLIRDQNSGLAPEAFLNAVQRQASEVWRGVGVPSYGLCEVFPTIQRTEATVSEFAAGEWPKPLTSVSAAPMSTNEAVTSVAAALLYSVITTRR